MALCLNSSFCNRRAPTHLKFLSTRITSSSSTSLPCCSAPYPSSPSSLRGTSIITRARRTSPRTSRLTTRQDEEKDRKLRQQQKLDLEEDDKEGKEEEEEEDDGGFVLPELPGEKPDFWEGPQWNAFGFFVQYQWAFGIAFALIACGIAVATYNEGATDFKQTPVYKQSMQSRELLDEPDDSASDVFEANPTEQAPALE